MTRYIVRRVLWMIPVFVFVSLITFTLMKLTPGGPWDRDKQLPPAVVALLNQRYNLDKPAWEQYLLYMGNALRGDHGPSYTYQNRSVTQILRQGLPHTASLGALATFLAVCIGVPLGIVAALRQNTSGDYVTLRFATIGASVASFVLAYILVIGTVGGGFAGNFGGRIDNLLMHGTDIFYAFPDL